MAVHHQKRLFLEFPFFFHSEIHLSTRKFQKVHSKSLAPLLRAAYMEDRVCLLIWGDLVKTTYKKYEEEQINHPYA